MFKSFYYLLMMCFMFAEHCIQAENYQLYNLDTFKYESSNGCWINDNGSGMGIVSTNGEPHPFHYIYMWNFSNELTVLENNYTAEKWSLITPKLNKINNLDQILVEKWSNKKGETQERCIGFLDLDGDFEKIVDLSKDDKWTFQGYYFNPIDYNDKGQILGQFIDKTNYSHSCFGMWDRDSGGLVDLTGILESILEDSFNVNCVSPRFINNSGDILLNVKLAKKVKPNPYKDEEKIIFESKCYFWNGKFYEVPLSTNHCVAMNNQGQVLIGSDQNAYLWDHINGSVYLGPFYPSAINDLSEVVGCFVKDKISYACYWKNGVFYDLNGIVDFQLFPNDKGGIWERLSWAVSINNKGQILTQGQIFGEQHSCVLTPQNE